MSAVQRSIDLLNAFTPQRPELGLADLVEATGLNKATVLRLVAVLCENELMFKSQASGAYRLGHACLRLGEVAKAPGDLLPQARPFMRLVRDRLQETVVLAVRSGDVRINVEQLEGLQAVRRVVAVGKPIPLYVSASSKVLLASMSDEEIEAYLQRTELKALSETTIHEPVRLWREVREIRRRGYAEGVREGGTEGATISAPIHDMTNTVVAAFTVTVPVSRYAKELRGRMIEEVTGTAEAISRSLGRARSA